MLYKYLYKSTSKLYVNTDNRVIDIHVEFYYL